MSEILGTAAYMTIGTKNLENSFIVYEKLGFSINNKGNAPVNWYEISDGSLVVILVEGEDEYMGFTYITKEIKKAIDQLDQLGLKPVMTAGTDESPMQIICQIREGLLLSINQSTDEVAMGIENKSLMDIDYLNPKLEDFPNKACGIFGEYAINIKDMEYAVQFWSKLGFKIGEQFKEPYPWTIVSDGMFIVGLHQTEEFDGSAITYFAPDMAVRIDSLKSQGLQIENMDDGNSGKLKTPEGQQFFLFSLQS